MPVPHKADERAARPCRSIGGDFFDLACDGITLEVAQSVWGADDEIVSHTQEEAVFDDACAGAQFGREFLQVGDGAEGAVINEVALVGNESGAVCLGA